MIHTILNCMLAASGLFSPHLIHAENSNDYQLFLAPKAGETGSAMIIVSENDKIKIYDIHQSNSPHTIHLPTDVSAWEFTDLDQDGQAEIIAVRDSEVLKITSTPETQEPTIEVLFKYDNLLSSSLPAPRILTLQKENNLLIALPTAQGFDLLTSSGEIVEHIPRSERTQFSTFSATSVPTSVVDPQNALEYRVSYYEAGEYLDSMSTSTSTDTELRQFTARQFYDAVYLPTEAWPWIPLRVPDEPLHRAYLAFQGNNTEETIIAVTQTNPNSGSRSTSSPTQLGPHHRYPGQALLPFGPPPDFNGDGWTDLMLCSLEEVKPTLTTASRAIVAGKWNLRLTTHLFLPQKRRFDPHASSVIQLNVPLSWLFDSGTSWPLRCALFRDFDGDERTDFACAHQEGQYNIWLSRSGKLNNKPDYTFDLPWPPMEVQFVTSLEAYHSPSIGILLEGGSLILENQNVLDVSHDD